MGIWLHPIMTEETIMVMVMTMRMTAMATLKIMMKMSNTSPSSCQT